MAGTYFSISSFSLEEVNYKDKSSLLIIKLTESLLSFIIARLPPGYGFRLAL